MHCRYLFNVLKFFIWVFREFLNFSFLDYCLILRRNIYGIGDSTYRNIIILFWVGREKLGIINYYLYYYNSNNFSLECWTQKTFSRSSNLTGPTSRAFEPFSSINVQKWAEMIYALWGSYLPLVDNPMSWFKVYKYIWPCEFLQFQKSKTKRPLCIWPCWIVLW